MKKIIAFLKKNITASLIVGGIVCGLIGYAISYVLPSKAVVASNIPQKEITCTLNYSQWLVKRLSIDQKLQIMYDGVEVDNPYLYDITVQNSGEYEISNEDFKENFVIQFRGCGKVLSARIHSSSNKSVNDEVLSNATIDGENVSFSDFFLNPDESFSVTVITDHSAEGITYHSRISGMASDSVVLKNTQKETHDRASHLMMALMGFVLLLSSAALIYTAYSQKRDKQKFQEEIEKYFVKDQNESEVSKSC